MEKILKEKQIINIIREYIEDKNADYAVMIDGEWGSGKTYFVKRKLKKNLDEYFKEKEQKLKFIYISTYGIKETKELDNKIYEEIIEEFMPEKLKKIYKDLEKSAESIYKIIKEIKKWPDIPKGSVRNLIEILQKKNEKNYILIFDDLERIEMPITEVLGYINEFVEHKGMKTIIIANEKEIIKKKMYSNSELKYIAAESEMLNIAKEKETLEEIFSNKYNKNTSEDKTISIKDLNDRVEKIFGEDLLYNQIKEKLIGITILFNPDLESVTDKIIDEYIKDNNIKKYVISNKKVLINLMVNKNHINIRTLKIAVKIIEKILVELYNMDLNKFEDRIINNIKQDIISYTMYACIKYKDGDLKNLDMPEFFCINAENDIREVYYGFKFIDDIIAKSYVDSERIQSVINSYMKTKSEDTNDYNDPINNLQGYWEMDDNEIEENYKLLKEKLSNQIYKTSSYPKIIYRVLKLITIGFSEQYVEDIKNIMLTNLQNKEDIEPYNDFDELDFVFNNQKEKEKYNEIMLPIKQNIENANTNGRKDNINTIINKEKGWGENFSNYCLNNRGEFQSQKEFFSLIDIDNIIDNIKYSHTKDISDFRRAMFTIYDFKNIKDYYENDLEKLGVFLIELEKIIEDEDFKKYDNSKKFNINWLKKNTEEIIEKISKS